ncbi:ArsR family transcriptional regulator [alpha proteobacterium AAP81b]|nr:ArsR family transcriptional regulator [alpha proteobacterium AAP81b]
MVHYSATRLDAAFAALADPTRRGIVERLGRGEASISDLATDFRMSLTGLKKHVSALEAAGLVTTAKIGRERRCRFGGDGFADAAAWLEGYRRLWDARFAALDRLTEELQAKDAMDAR